MKRLKELREKRAKLIADSRGLLDAASTANRDLTADEQRSYDQMWADIEALNGQITREERQVEAERELAEQRANGRDPDEQRGGAPGEQRPATGPASEEYRSAFRSYLRGGREGLSVDEIRALSAGTASQGGFLVAPQQMVTGLIAAVKDLVFIRQRANVLAPIATAASLGAVSLESDVSDSDWTGELTTGSEDSSLSFGKRELAPHPLAKRIKISNKLLRQAPDSESIVRDRLAYKFGITEEKAFLLGDGVQKPLGIFTASANGISTARDISNGNTATGITFDGLLAAKYSLKAPYLENAAWAFHRNAIEQIAKLKDNNGQYLWQPSKKDGEPDRILALPFFMSEYVPNTFTTGKYVGALADWRFYWIIDALDMQIQRLVELYAEANQTGLICRRETDGMPVLEEAFTRVKLG
jgi:HK97 family phage major capsid protein